MRLSRRQLMKLAGVSALAGCASEVTSPDLDLFDDAGVDDAGPDQSFDADPVDGGASTNPVDGGASTNPVDGGASTNPVDGGASTNPVDGGASTNPVDGGTSSNPVDGGASTDGGRGIEGNPDFRSLPERAEVFPIGVMAGDATDTSVMFWTRFTGRANLTLRVLEKRDGGGFIVRFNGRVTPASGGFVRVIVNGLRPGRQHMFGFLTGPSNAPTGRSLAGHVKTAIDSGSTETVTFAGAACTNQRQRPFPVLVDAARRDDLEFFIHAGDHVYTDFGRPADSLEEYREKYAQNWSSQGLTALHRSLGMYLTWDDHEVRNDWNPETVSRARLSAARRAFFEHRATRRSDEDPDRIWRKFRWGRTAEVFILDCRGERLPSTRSTNPARPSQYISRAQMNWLKTGLSDSPCVFKFIVNSVPIVNRPGPDSDNWNAYASQRQELLNHITNERLDGVVFLSGDVHFGAVCKVEPSGPWSRIWEVIMGPAGAYRDSRPPIRESQFPVFVYNKNNYTVLKANPRTRTLSVDFIDATSRPIAGASWSHRF